MTFLHNRLSKNGAFKGRSSLTYFQNNLHNRNAAVKDQISYRETKC